MERNTEISMYLDAPYNKERNIEISMYLYADKKKVTRKFFMYPYADNMERGTWKFPCIFLVNVQASTEIKKRRQKITKNAFFTFWKLLHSLIEFSNQKSVLFPNICPFGYAWSIKVSTSCWVSFLCHFSYRPVNSLETACFDPLQWCINTLTHFSTRLGRYY